MPDEKKARLPGWARRVLVIVAIVAPVSGAIATTVKTYYEVSSAQRVAKQADRKSEVSYETLAPAVQELQAISEEEQQWANEMTDYTQDLERRIYRLETYIEVLSDRRNMPEPIPEVATSQREPASTSELPPEIRKAARPIPQSLDKAKAYQQQRIEEKCSANDPACGMVDL